MDPTHVDASCTRNPVGPLPRVGIVGAGLAGLACGARLQERGLPVEILDKGRGPGGRTATRRELLADQRLLFDHGAQYFTVRDADFADFLEPLRRGGSPLVARWESPVVALRDGETSPARGSVERNVFVPGMNALTRRLASSLPCRFETRVAHAHRSNGVWELRGDAGTLLTEAEILIVTAPAEQALDLLPASAPFRSQLSRITYAPCWAVMVHFGRSLGLEFGGAFVEDSALAWVARDGSKPGRGDVGPGESWVLHASPEWSRLHLEDSPEEVTAALLRAFAKATAQSLPRVELVRAHRWRFALPTAAAGEACLFDAVDRLGIAGDACPEGARVEGAFLSGRALAERIIAEPSLPA